MELMEHSVEDVLSSSDASMIVFCSTMTDEGPVRLSLVLYSDNLGVLVRLPHPVGHRSPSS